MRVALKKGFSFGLASGIITTLGMIIGLDASTHSKMVVIGGILIIAVADALSDALGMHVSQESETTNSTKQVWESTIATFLTKLVVACTFILPVVLFELSTAIIISAIWGLSLIAVFSYYLAKREKASPAHVITEHLAITVLVIIATHYIGVLVRTFFG